MINMAKPMIGEEEITAVKSVMESGMLAHGKVVEEFEEKFAKYIGVNHAVAVNSGTAALVLALLANGIGEGDEVITTPFSFVATANAIKLVGATPVFVDINPQFNINANIIEDYITSNTTAILPVHLYGQPCDMKRLTDICNSYDITLIEDCCQAHGAAFEGKKVGSFGTGCFSFYPTKNMTTGEGGMITTNDTLVASIARKLRNHGQFTRYNSDCLGGNYRSNNIAAAIGIEQLKKLDEMNLRRWNNARIYSESLKDVFSIILPKYGFVDEDTNNHVFHQYTIRVTDTFPVNRDRLQEILDSQGIATETYYPIIIPQQKYYQQKYKKQPSYTAAVSATKQALSLPIHPGLSMDDLKHIIDVIINVSKGELQ